MGTIADKLNRVLESKSQIKDALISKGVEIPDDTPFRSYPSLVDNIQTGGADLNIAFGENPPEDTSKLWVNSDSKSLINMSHRYPSLQTCYFNELLLKQGLTSASVGHNIFVFDTKNIYRYDIAVDSITKLDIVFPVQTQYRSAATVGDKIYLFGGTQKKSNGTGVYVDEIYVYDTVNNTLELLSITIPTGGTYCYAFSVDSKIYIVRGYSIHIFDTDKMTITTSDVSFQNRIHAAPVCIVNNSIYIFGYTYDSGQRESYDILRYDITSDVLTTIGSTQTFLSRSVYSKACAVGTNVYLYGPLDAIEKFDCLTNEYSIINVHTPSPGRVERVCATAVDDCIYYFGGDEGYCSIVIFDTLSECCIPDYHPCLMGSSILNYRSMMSIASAGSKVFMFGGRRKAYTGAKYGVYSDISVYDLNMKKRITLNTSLSTPVYSAAVASVGNNIYLFGGHTTDGRLDTVSMFDIENETVTTLSTALDMPIDSICSVTVGGRVYLFGGNTNTGSTDAIYVFDTNDMSLTLLNVKVPIKLFGASATIVRDKIYLFGGCTDEGYSDSIYMFDVESETFTNVSIRLPSGMGYMGAGTVNDIVYLFGGLTTNGPTSTIMRVDIKSEQCQTLSLRCTIPCFGSSATTIGNIIYVVNGEGDLGMGDNLFLAYNMDRIPSPEQLHICVRNPSHPVTLLNTGDITLQTAVNSVYKGNSDGTCTKVPAHVYENGEWVEI